MLRLDDLGGEEPTGTFAVSNVSLTFLEFTRDDDVVVAASFPSFQDVMLPEIGREVTIEIGGIGTQLVVWSAETGQLLFAGGALADPAALPATVVPGDADFTCQRGSLQRAPATVEISTDDGPVRLGTGDREVVNIDGDAYVAWVTAAFRFKDTHGSSEGAGLFLAPPR